jgi:hypothetical protein
MTPSLANFFWSIGLGAGVVALIVAALFIISQKDKVTRRG